MTTGCSAFMGSATMLALPSLCVWRCRPGCGKIILELEYDGRTFMRHRCSCNRWHQLPDDADYLRREDRR